MKKTVLFLFAFLFAFALNAQWVQITSGLGDAAPTSMFAFADTVYLGTDGDGLFRTLDNGSNWVDINGDLPNPNVNAIFWGPTSHTLFVATNNGPFFTQNLAHFQNCTSTGLTNTDINYFWFGGDDDVSYAIGTEGGGVFASSNYIGPWVSYSNGLTGNGLFINDMGGYSDGSTDYAVAGTNNGVYFSTDNFSTWVASNNGLSGPALIVNKLTGLGSLVIIATNGGLFMTYDFGANWVPLVTEVKLNSVFILQSPLSSTGFFIYAFGEKGYYSEDFKSYIEIDMGGIPGEVTCATANSTDVFIGVLIEEEYEKLISGGMYRQPIAEIVGINEQVNYSSSVRLGQNYPNPCSEITTVNYFLNEPGFINLNLYDHLGNQIASFVNQYLERGNYSLDINVGNYEHGVYFYSIEINSKTIITKRMVILE